MQTLKHLSRLFVVGALWSLTLNAYAADTAKPRVRMVTNVGAIELELDRARAPQTVANFLQYAESGFYNGTLFHRVIPNFMIQGGGFAPGMRQKSTRAPIKNEADNGLKNTVGTIAMARTGDPHSATAQFFINTADNPALDHRGKDQAGWGYAVFGRVTRGQDVVKKIASVETGRFGPHQDVPQKDVTIEQVKILAR